MEQSKSNKCVSCGAALHGEYCHVCGEQTLNDRLRSIYYVDQNIFEELSSLDGRVWHTLKTMVCRPGQYEYDHHIGRRNVYIKPLTLFLIINVLFVALSPLTDFYVNFYSQLNAQAYSQFTTPYLLQFIEQKGVTVQQFAEKYDQLVLVIARSLIILQVPIFALLSSIVLYRKDYFSSDYFTFGLNIHSWVLSWIVLAQVPAIILSYPIAFFIEDFSRWYLYMPMMTLGVVTYIALSAKVMFRFSWLQLFLRLPLLLVIFPISHFCYRFLQLIIAVSLVDV